MGLEPRLLALLLATLGLDCRDVCWALLLPIPGVPGGVTPFPFARLSPITFTNSFTDTPCNSGGMSLLIILAASVAGDGGNIFLPWELGEPLREVEVPTLSVPPTAPSPLNHFEKNEGLRVSVPLVDGEGVLCRPITAAAAPSTIDDTAEEENSFLCKEGELPALAVPEGSVPCLGGGNGFRDLPDGKVSDFEVEMLSNDFCLPKSVIKTSLDLPRDPM